MQVLQGAGVQVHRSAGIQSLKGTATKNLSVWNIGIQGSMSTGTPECKSAVLNSAGSQVTQGTGIHIFKEQ